MTETTSAKPAFGWTYDKPCDTMEWTELHGALMKCTTKVDDVRSSDLTITCLSEGDEALAALAESQPFLHVLVQEQGEKFKAGKVGSRTAVARTISSEGSLQKQVVLGVGSFVNGSKVGSAIADLCASEKGVKSCAVDLSSCGQVQEDFLFGLATNFYADLYSDNRYRNGDKQKFPAKELEKVWISFSNNDNIAEKADAAIDKGIKMARGVALSKDIVNAPHSVLNSLSLMNTALRLAEESPLLEVKILDKNECEKRGMGSFLGVARGSETPPYFIHLTYRPADGKVNRKVGCVGKGLLFDTGGYNIKTQMMALMKFDCGGAAAVLGAARAIAALEPEGVEVNFCVAACENMVNAKAYVPSDILIASNGKSIEVLNTDAEGRLTLADALVYADIELGCEKIIELSTLTGACIVALGTNLSGVFTKYDDLAEELATASKVTNDQSWRLPMHDEYNKLLESKIADIKNIGTRPGSSIQAALFLQNFVSEDKPFAHIDIAGPVWDEKTGATGYGARLVTEWASQQGKSS